VKAYFSGFRSHQQPAFVANGLARMKNGLTYSLPAAFLFWPLVRRGASLYPKLIGAAAGGLAGLAGLSVLEIWHWGVVLISSAAHALFGAAVE
jgi:hypothetical protein